MKGTLKPPPISDREKSPLVEQLLELIEQQNFWLYPRFPIRENNVNPTYSEHGAIITVFENLQKSVREDRRHQLRGKSYP
jgi:hypothetical protein